MHVIADTHIVHIAHYSKLLYQIQSDVRGICHTEPVRMYTFITLSTSSVLTLSYNLPLLHIIRQLALLSTRFQKR